MLRVNKFLSRLMIQGNAKLSERNALYYSTGVAAVLRKFKDGQYSKQCLPYFTFLIFEGFIWQELHLLTFNLERFLFVAFDVSTSFHSVKVQVLVTQQYTNALEASVH